MAPFALGSLGDLARRAVHAALEARVSLATATGFGHFLPLPRLGQVADQLARINVMYDRAAGNHYVEVIARPAGFIPARTALPGLGLELPRHAEIGQCIHRWFGNQVHAAAVTAIATVRPAPFHVFLAAETQAAVATVAGYYANCGFIDEFHDGILSVKTKNPARGGVSIGAALVAATGRADQQHSYEAFTTLTNWRFFGPLRSNLTAPSFFANSV